MYKINNPGWHMHCERHDPLNDLGNFIHDCAEDPVTRVMGTTALVLALAQASGPTMLRQPPGFLLINASSGATDQIDEVMKNLTGLERPQVRPEAESYERHLRTMEVALKTSASAPRPIRSLPTPSRGTVRHEPRPLPDPYQDALYHAFGSGRVRCYSHAYDDRFGWAGSESSRHLILRVNSEDDRLQLRHDLRQRAKILLHPQGYGTLMHLETKTLSIAGSLQTAEWDLEGTVSIIENSIPVLFLPHTADKQLVIPEELHWLSIGLASDSGKVAHDPLSAWLKIGDIGGEGIQQQILRLRERLTHFPVDYEFYLMSTVRELLNWCVTLVSAMSMHGEPLEDQRALLMDLYSMVLQGISLGIESLGWHGYGFASTCDRAQTCKVLMTIRKCGSIAKRDLLRQLQWLKADRRDQILAAFEAEGIVRLTSHEVLSVPFADYWQQVSQRVGTGLPARLCKAKNPKSTDSPTPL